MDKKETTLKRVRSSKGFTQKSLAEATGISLRTIQHWEQGSKDFSQAAALTVYKVAQVLGVEMVELLDIPEPEEKEENQIGGVSINKIIGYNCEDGHRVVNEAEAEIVKEIFNKVKAYTDNPPAELVTPILEIACEKGENITYEEAKERVTLSAIYAYIARELNSNAEIIKVLSPQKTQLKGKFKACKHTSEPIVSRELWEKAQEKEEN